MDDPAVPPNDVRAPLRHSEFLLIGGGVASAVAEMCLLRAMLPSSTIQYLVPLALRREFGDGGRFSVARENSCPRGSDANHFLFE